MMAGQSKADAAYRHLAAELHVGTRGPGAQIVVKDVATDLSMTETPVREALERLVGQGAVTNEGGRRGFAVPSLLATDLADHFALAEFAMLKALWLTTRAQTSSRILADAALPIDAVSAIETFASALAHVGDSLLMTETLARLNLVLAPYRRLEPVVIPRWQTDIEQLQTASDRSDIEESLRNYTSRRIQGAAGLVDARNKANRPNANRFQI
jgi:hypothetical protein